MGDSRMIFSWESIIKIVQGVKTQTRRVYKSGQIFYGRHEMLIQKAVPTGDAFLEVQNFIERHPAFVMNLDTNRIIYREGQVIAVQSGRGKGGLWHEAYEKRVVEFNGNEAEMRDKGYVPLKIEIMGIKPSEVFDISQEDIEREGFKTFKQFVRVWAEMHDKRLARKWNFMHNDADELRQFIRQYSKGIKWTAWALDFKVVGE